jgi:hypothetical protein
MDGSLPFVEGALPELCASAHAVKTNKQINGNTILRKLISSSVTPSFGTWAATTGPKSQEYGEEQVRYEED